MIPYGMCALYHRSAPSGLSGLIIQKRKGADLMKKTGYVQVYTGNGKGKTTAALGLVLRAAGAGMRVLFLQFLKEPDYSEHESLKLLDRWVTVRNFCGHRRIGSPVTEGDREQARQGLVFLHSALASGEYDLVVADEINVAVMIGVLTEDEVLGLIDARPESVELVLTGRGATESVMERADLITEMREIRHYFTAGVQARKGIEK